MTWQKLDDMFAEHRKITPLSDQAFRLYVSAGNYCCRALTDGYLSIGKVRELASRYDDPKSVIDELLTVLPGEQYPLWESTPDGRVKIHDFEHYNPTRGEVETRREQNAERQARFRDRHREGGNGVTNALPDAFGNAFYPGTRDPYPQPVPVPESRPLPAAGARVREGESESRPEDAAPSSYSTQIVLEQILAILPPDARRRSEMERLARSVERFPGADYIGAAKDAASYGQSLIDAGESVRSWARLYGTTLERWHAEGRTDPAPETPSEPAGVFGRDPSAQRIWSDVLYGLAIDGVTHREEQAGLNNASFWIRLEADTLILPVSDPAMRARLEELVPHIQAELVSAGYEGANFRLESHTLVDPGN